MAKGKKVSAAQRARLARANAEHSKPKPAAAPQKPVISTVFPGWIFWLGVGLLLAASLLSLNLSLSHLGFATPGCGEGGSCDRLKETAFAYVPGTFRSESGSVSGWPIAYIGLGYFVGMLVVWVLSKGSGLNIFVRWIARLGAVASMGYLGIMVLGVVDGICPLCVGVHLLNLGFVASIELAVPATRAHAARSVGVGLAGLVVVNGVLLGVQSGRAEQLATQADQESDELVDRLTAGSSGSASGSSSTIAPRPTSFDLPRETHGAGRAGFTGRYLIGPEEAAVRIVTVSGYQCGACQIVEAEVKRLLESRDDVSLSIIQFPASSTCNPTLSQTNMHPAACKTAQIAEAAGILGGSDAFWAMSFKLFEYMSQRDNLGRAPSDVPDPIVDQWVREFGFQPDQFRRTMASPEVAELIAADTHLARSVGTNSTPMVFINGEEFRGWNTQGQITRTVDRLIAAGLPRVSSANDSPPGASTRLVEQWRSARTHPEARSVRDWGRGPNSPQARIVVWGCYDEINTQRVDAIARELVAEYPQISYEFRFYPFNVDCNARATGRRYTQSCVKVRASVAAGILGGAEAHLRMHDWIMDRADGFREADLPAQFTSLGLNADEALSLMQSQQVADLIQTDSNALQGLQSRGVTARPAVFINERSTPWLFGTDMVVLPDIIREILGGG